MNLLTMCFSINKIIRQSKVNVQSPVKRKYYYYYYYCFLKVNEITITYPNNTKRYNRTKHTTIQNTTIQNNTIEHTTIQNNTIEHTTIQNNTIEHTTIHVNTIEWNTLEYIRLHEHYCTIQWPCNLHHNYLCTWIPLYSIKATYTPTPII